MSFVDCDPATLIVNDDDDDVASPRSMKAVEATYLQPYLQCFIYKIHAKIHCFF